MLNTAQKTQLQDTFSEIVTLLDQCDDEVYYRFAKNLKASLSRIKKTSVSTIEYETKKDAFHVGNIIRNTGKSEFYYNDICARLAVEYGTSIRSVTREGGVLKTLIDRKFIAKFVDEEHPKKWHKYVLIAGE